MQLNERDGCDEYHLFNISLETDTIWQSLKEKFEKVSSINNCEDKSRE